MNNKVGAPDTPGSNRTGESQSNIGVNHPDGRASKSPHLPHDRDESSGMTGDIQNEQVQQAKKDLDRGLRDTSRGEESDDTYQKQK